MNTDNNYKFNLKKKAWKRSVKGNAFLREVFRKFC